MQAPLLLVSAYQPTCSSCACIAVALTPDALRSFFKCPRTCTFPPHYPVPTVLSCPPTFPPFKNDVPLGEVLHIARAIASGLAQLHPRIVHRDLKPSERRGAGRVRAGCSTRVPVPCRLASRGIPHKGHPAALQCTFPC